MLLRLVPGESLPTILFTLAFPPFPAALPIPLAWDAHLRQLQDALLPAPPSLQALDKSVACAVLLDSVSFDLTSRTVTCTFIDGAREHWPLPPRCAALLNAVLRDVVSRSPPDRPQSQPHSPPPPPPASPQPSPGPRKPKKRRSVLAALASLVHPSPPPPSPPPLPPPQPPSPSLSSPAYTTPPVPSAVLLRRRARAALVDAFRRFVTTQLRPPASYPAWAARSTAARAAAEMARLLEQALHPQLQLEGTGGGGGSSAAADDTEDAASSTSSTTTASSSLHTPPDAHDPPAVAAVAAAGKPAAAHALRSPAQPASAPLPPPEQQQQIMLSPSAYNAYVALRALHARAVALAQHFEAEADDAARDADEEDAGIASPSSSSSFSPASASSFSSRGEGRETRDARLEVQSRRRAWSAGFALPPRPGGFRGGGNVALGVPRRGSPLRCGWTRADVERAEEGAWADCAGAGGGWLACAAAAAAAAAMRGESERPPTPILLPPSPPASPPPSERLRPRLPPRRGRSVSFAPPAGAGAQGAVCDMVSSDPARGAGGLVKKKSREAEDALSSPRVSSPAAVAAAAALSKRRWREEVADGEGGDGVEDGDGDGAGDEGDVALAEPVLLWRPPSPPDITDTDAADPTDLAAAAAVAAGLGKLGLGLAPTLPSPSSSAPLFATTTSDVSDERQCTDDPPRS